MALALWRARRCPNCGRDIEVCTAEGAEGNYRVPDPVRCHATTALSIAQHAYRNSPQPEALLWRNERR